MFRKLFTIFLLLSGFIAVNFSSNVYAQDSNLTPKKTKSKYKKARVLQTSTAKKVTKVVEALERQKIVKVKDPENPGKFIEKEEDDPDWAQARSILTELLNNRANMKSYDRSVMWNYWGYIYFSDEDYDQAMYAYEQLLAEPEATLPLRTASLLTLAQLNLVKENWDKGIRSSIEGLSEFPCPNFL